MRIGDNLEFLDGQHAVETESDALTFRASTPIRIHRWGVIISVEALGTDGVLALNVDRHAADGTVTEEAAAGGTTLTVVADEVGAVHFTEPTEDVLVKPGDVVTIEVTTGMGTSGDFIPFIQYQKLNWDVSGDNANFNDATPTTRMVDATT